MEGAMTFGERVVGAMSLSEAAFEDVERDPTAMGQAVGVIVIAAIAAAIGNLFRIGPWIITGVITSLVFSVVGSAIVWLVGTKLLPEPTTKADFQETFRTLAFASAPGFARVITIIPFLGPLIGFVIALWSIAALVVAVKAVLDYASIGKAIAVVLISWVITFCILFVLLLPLGVGMAMMGSR
jgi:hypothetical protein